MAPMDHAAQQQLLKRSCDALRRGRPEMTEGFKESPIERYTDVTRWPAELRLLRSQPQAIAAAADLANPGDWLAREILGIPVLLTRAADGIVRAFLNVCRHRGARVAANGQGNGKRSFSCPYHAWTYSADGSLRAMPAEYGFPGLDKKSCGLRRLAVTQRAGIVWAIVDPAHAGCDIDILLEPLVTELEQLGFANHVRYAPRELPLDCNWKLVVDGSLEGYHFKIAHRETIAHMFADNLQIIDEFGLNRRLYLVRSAMAELAANPAGEFRLREYGNLLYFFFPNTLVLVQRDHAQVSVIEPTGVDTTTIREFALIPEPPVSPQAIVHWDKNVALYRAALAEDYAMMQSIQSTLHTGANTALKFGGYEFAAARFHEQLEAKLGLTGAG
jgi:phenylpropionate dioxygenase-like ring-hydroxylating dioxygenase large terminal subunit